MRFMRILLISILILVSYLPAENVTASNVPTVDEILRDAPRVFLDCKANYPAARAFDINHIKSELTYINYVWDRNEADVHVMITSQNTASNGYEFELSFIGQNRFKEMNDTLVLHVKAQDSDATARDAMVHSLVIGLTRYIAHTTLAAKLAIKFNQEIKSEETRDKWNYWVFSLGVNGWADGQEASRLSSVYGNFDANRVTPALKIQLGLRANLQHSRYIIDDEVYKSSSESYGFNGLMVKSLGPHWSAGGYLQLSSSTFNNLDLKWLLAPAIEYDIFPYEKATRKQVRFLYRLNLIRNRYREMTVYDKMSETLLQQSLEAAWSIKQPWGSVGGSIEFSNYFNDLKKNNLDLYGSVSLKVWKGLSVNLSGSYSRIRDQISLPKGDASTEEILLNLRQLASSYSYFTSFGISYSFGSIYSNVVNPRFGGSSGGSIIIMN